MEKLEKAPKELKGSATLQVEPQYELTSTLELVCLAAYVSEDGLVGNHWEERPLGIANFICPNTGEFQAKKLEQVGRGAGRREGIGNFWDSICNVYKENNKSIYKE